MSCQLTSTVTQHLILNSQGHPGNMEELQKDGYQKLSAVEQGRFSEHSAYQDSSWQTSQTAALSLLQYNGQVSCIKWPHWTSHRTWLQNPHNTVTVFIQPYHPTVLLFHTVNLIMRNTYKTCGNTRPVGSGLLACNAVSFGNHRPADMMSHAARFEHAVTSLSEPKVSCS